MSKFGAIIEQAKSQNTSKPENKNSVKPINTKTGKQENQNIGKPANQKAIKQESQKLNESDKRIAKKIIVKDVNLSIKVPETRRRHWVSEAKRQGTSLTAVILESLSKRFGEPE